LISLWLDQHAILSPATSAPIVPVVRVEQGFGMGAQIGVLYDLTIAKLYMVQTAQKRCVCFA
jgi:acetyl/propionyl-CoA carboxylase alpha subunit